MFIPFGIPGLFDEFMQGLDVAVFETPLAARGQTHRIVALQAGDDGLRGQGCPQADTADCKSVLPPKDDSEFGLRLGLERIRCQWRNDGFGPHQPA